MPQMINGTPRFSPQTFRQLNIVGDVGLKKSDLPENARIVRLRINGQDVYMRLDTELNTAELEFEPNETYARDLYRSILTKRIEVVGDQGLRNQILSSVGQSRPLKVRGYVFDRLSPYLVVQSVSVQ